MKTAENKKLENKNSFQETLAYLYDRNKKYDGSHENFIVPWQMGIKKKKEFNV